MARIGHGHNRDSAGVGEGDELAGFPVAGCQDDGGPCHEVESFDTGQRDRSGPAPAGLASDVVGNADDGVAPIGRQRDRVVGEDICNNGTLTLINTTISGSDTWSRGGGLFNASGASCTITGCNISGNTNWIGEGGGIRSLGSLTITNSTIANNYGYNVGGIYGDAHVFFTTIAYNNATLGAGGVASDNGNFIPANTIIAKNTLGGGTPSEIRPGSVNYPAHLLDEYSNVIGDAASADGFTDFNGTTVGQDPKFATTSPVNNGGPTSTIAILAGSPAVNEGVWIPQVPTDQRGLPRIDVFQPDIGAFELHSHGITMTVDTLADESDGDVSPGHFSLREAIGFLPYTDGADTITFNALLSGTINLTGGALNILGDANIRGFLNPITIDANSLSGVFVTSGKNVMIAKLGITRGHTGSSTLSAAIHAFGGTVTLSEVTISGCSSDSNGGGICFIGDSFGGTLSITDSTISGNTSGGYGGGLLADNVAVTIVNSTFAHNTAVGGSALTIWDSGNISNTTIAYNTATLDGAGALYASHTKLTSTIIAQNSGGNIAQDVDGSSSNNLIDTTAGTGA